MILYISILFYASIIYDIFCLWFMIVKWDVTSINKIVMNDFHYFKTHHFSRNHFCKVL